MRHVEEPVVHQGLKEGLELPLLGRRGEIVAACVLDGEVLQQVPLLLPFCGRLNRCRLLEERQHCVDRARAIHRESQTPRGR